MDYPFSDSEFRHSNGRCCKRYHTPAGTIQRSSLAVKIISLKSTLFLDIAAEEIIRPTEPAKQGICDAGGTSAP